MAGVCGVESVPVRPPHCPHVAVSKDGERAPPEAVAVDTAAATAAAFFLPFLRGWYRYSGYRSRCFLFSSYQAGWSTSSSIRLGLSEQTSACFSHISFISCEHCLHISPIILEISGLGLPGFWATTAAWLCCRNNINAGSNVSHPKLEWKKKPMCDCRESKRKRKPQPMGFSGKLSHHSSAWGFSRVVDRDIYSAEWWEPAQLYLVSAGDRFLGGLRSSGGWI